MDRRSFGKLMGLLGCASCVPKGKPMPQLGDLFAKLAMGDSLMASEIEQLRLVGNDIQTTASQVSGLLDANGTLGAHALDDEFGVLPHEAIVLFRNDTQSIPYDTATSVLFDSSTYLIEKHKWGWSPGSATVTIPKEGMYLIAAGCRFETMTLNDPCWMRIFPSRLGPGSQPIALCDERGAAPATYTTQVTGATGWYFKRGDTLEAKVYHKSTDTAAKNIDNFCLSIVRFR